jgi:hypothetical protein
LEAESELGTSEYVVIYCRHEAVLYRVYLPGMELDYRFAYGVPRLIQKCFAAGLTSVA